MSRLLALLVLGSGSCRAPAAPPAGEWVAEVLLERDAKLNGCAVGDVDPRHPGAEVAVVTSTGEVIVARPGTGGWTAETVARMPGELVQCALGDADPNHEGQELVVVGMKEGDEGSGGEGAAFVVYPPRPGSSSWSAARVFLDPALLHGVLVGDVDPTRAGEEILVTGFSRTAQLVFREGGGWASEPLAELPGPGKCAVRTDGAVAVACADGSVVRLYRAEDGWESTVLDRGDAGRARLAAAGGRLLVAGDDGRLVLLEAGGGATELLHEEGRLRGAVLADLAPDRPGLEAATAGYAGRLHVLHEGPQGWTDEVALVDEAGFHHLAAGELSAEGAGLELVACGIGGRLWLVRRVLR